MYSIDSFNRHQLSYIFRVYYDCGQRRIPAQGVQKHWNICRYVWCHICRERVPQDEKIRVCRISWILSLLSENTLRWAFWTWIQLQIHQVLRLLFEIRGHNYFSRTRCLPLDVPISINHAISTSQLQENILSTLSPLPGRSRFNNLQIAIHRQLVKFYGMIGENETPGRSWAGIAEILESYTEVYRWNFSPINWCWLLEDPRRLCFFSCIRQKRRRLAMPKVQPPESTQGSIVTTASCLARTAALLVGCTPAGYEQEANQSYVPS